MYNYGGAWTQLQPQQQQLPSGWEAKWDPGSSRWFYINHRTKTTQWERPAARPAQYQPPTPKQTTTSFIESDNANVKILLSEYNGVSEEYLRSLLRVFNHKMDAVRRTLNEKGYTKKQSAPQNAIQPKQHFVNGLKSQFPDASLDVIREVLVSTNNSFAGARTSLEAMGYKKKNTATPAKKEVKKPATTTPTTKTTKVATSSGELSEQTKKSRLQELKKKFPKLDSSLLEMALKGTMYDIKMASAVLQASIESVSSKETPTRSKSPTKTTTTSATSSSTTSGSTSASLAPVIFGAEDTSEAKKDPTPSTTSAKSSPTKASTSTTPKYTYTQPQKRDYPKWKKTVVERKRVPVGGYVSANRITPKGPDPTLVNGPNLSLLLDTRVQVSGPNPANRCGPQASNRCGPQSSNAVGRAGIDVGPALDCHVIFSLCY